jgi:hypothetical protein
VDLCSWNSDTETPCPTATPAELTPSFLHLARSAGLRQQLFRIAVAVLYPWPTDPAEANFAAYPDDMLPCAP